MSFTRRPHPWAAAPDAAASSTCGTPSRGCRFWLPACPPPPVSEGHCRRGGRKIRTRGLHVRQGATAYPHARGLRAAGALWGGRAMGWGDCQFGRVLPTGREPSLVGLSAYPLSLPGPPRQEESESHPTPGFWKATPKSGRVAPVRLVDIATPVPVSLGTLPCVLDGPIALPVPSRTPSRSRLRPLGAASASAV